MQTWALIVDSYRLLLSRKLFWITLLISAVVVLVYASIGFDETGWFLFFGLTHFDSDVFRAGSEWATALYLGFFSSLIVGYWFTWAAAILALVSTAPIFNDFMADGSIDLVLSKPLGRVRIFFVKYLGGLLFVLLQMLVFTIGVFLCVGWRVGEWKPEILLAIPLVVVFFSYLYAVSVLWTMLTHSTIASLMLTLIVWFVIFGVHKTENVLNQMRIQSEVRAEFATMAVRGNAKPAVKTPPANEKEAEQARQERIAKQRREAEARKERLLEEAEDFKRWQNRVRAVLAVLPKTKQTTDLVERWTVESGQSLEAILVGAAQRDAQQQQQKNNNPRNQMVAVQKQVEEYYRDRSAWYIIGTSLAFEAVVLGFACLLFVYRDF